MAFLDSYSTMLAGLYKIILLTACLYLVLIERQVDIPETAPVNIYWAVSYTHLDAADE